MRLPWDKRAPRADRGTGPRPEHREDAGRRRAEAWAAHVEARRRRRTTRGDGPRPGTAHRDADTASPAAASTAALACARSPGSTTPAAFGWPPPPKRAAIRATLTSPLARRLTFTSPASSRKRIATFAVRSERG